MAGAEANREKTRVSVRIAGRFLTVLTDVDPKTVREAEKELEARTEELVRSSPRMATREGRTDAVILCAMEAVSREKAAEKRAEEAERRADELSRKYGELMDEYRALSFRRSAGIPEDGGGDPGNREDTVARIRKILIKIAGCAAEEGT